MPPLPSWLAATGTVAVACLDGEGRVLSANRGFAERLGQGEGARLLEPDRDVLLEDGLPFTGHIVFGTVGGRRVSLQGTLHDEAGCLLLVSEAPHEPLEALQAEVKRLSQTLDETSRQDSLTGLANRRHLDARMDEELLRWQRYHRPLSLILLDLDHFAEVNAEYGREVADEALQHVATLLGQSIRTLDVAARYGGEEFAVLLPETNDMGALIVAERLRLELESQILLPLVQPLTASLGVASLMAGERREQFFNRATRALRLSKEMGRNRVTLAPES